MPAEGDGLQHGMLRKKTSFSAEDVFFVVPLSPPLRF
jgi:hypothetical protein